MSSLLLPMLVKAALFLGLGLLAWWLSRRWPMPGYGGQPVAAFDRWFLPAALAMAALIEFGLEPLLAWALQRPGPAAPFRLEALRSGPLWAQATVYLLLTDFLGYWAHRAMHGRWLWRVHAFHHSPTALNWMSGMRGSPVHMLLVLAPGAVVGAMVLAADSPALLLPLMVLEIGSQHFTHSNIRLPWARQLEWLLVTPRMHFVHHHRDPAHGNSNYGFYFSVWDHLFGTYTDAGRVGAGALGLEGEPRLGALMLGLRPVESTPEPR